MHELSIVKALIEQCEKIAHQNNATKIYDLHVKLGVLSGVERHFFQTTFDTFKQDTICDKANLHIKMQKIILSCNKCKAQTQIDENVFVCPKCKSDDFVVVDGEDMVLMSLEME